jgi:N6-L-threonylcarbamoyladenine synthase
MTLVLGIETSCDDTAAAIIRRGADGSCAILSNEIWTAPEEHAAYGGVVPEIAARSHVEKIDQVVHRALARADIGVADLDAIAATAGPGLIGGVMVGLTAAKAMALAHGKRLVPVNHLEGHALTARMVEPLRFPFLLLLISGGHTQLVAVDGVGAYRRIGSTIDDAAGEAFDKTAKLLGLGQPGGPSIEAAARRGDPKRFAFPEPLARREDFDFSLSGLKTAVRLVAENLPRPTAQDIADVAASFQTAIANHLEMKTSAAMKALRPHFGDTPSLVVAGGVAANSALRQRLIAAAANQGWRFLAPPSRLCTDNGAMIAWAGAERIAAGLVMDHETALAFAPRARWPLAEPPAGREHGGGKRGPKA